MTKPDLKEYQKHLKREAKKFKLTAEDLTNLTDVGMMMPYWMVEDVFKVNKMKVWWLKFCERIEEITLKELK